MEARADEKEYEILTRDTFVKRLQLTHFESRLKDRDVASGLYISLSDFLSSLGVVRAFPKRAPADALSFIVPGTPIHVNLKEVPKEAIETFALCYLLIQHQVIGQPLLVAASFVKAVWKNLSVLDVQRGERCIVESLAEMQVTTAEEVALNLTDTPCRYPDSGCQFLGNYGKCSILLDATDRTLQELEKKKVVQLKVLTDPKEWQVRL